jgi:hypothetical protein
MPSVRPSSKTGERGVCCACCGLPSAATIRGETAAFASAERKASRGVGSASHPAVRASACSAPRRPQIAGRKGWWWEGRRERRSSAGQPTSTTARTCLWVHTGGLGFGCRRWVERAWSPWCAHGLKRSGGGLLDCEGVVEGNRVPVAEREEALGTEEICLRFWDRQRVYLVELVDAMRRNGRRGLR